ncbi:flagellar brake protein [Ornithinibacillus salinisoli]|uniref:Flagellar brake protein n=1 Tax=Ornithinibacillus salinisoli TaxID=1848459 RepID=A0ABW4W4C5_9BACI
MNIGTLLTLEYIKSEKKEKYKCKVIEKSDTLLIIDYPINIATKKTTVLRKGTQLEVSYVGEDNSVYSFTSIIKGKHKLNVPALSLEIPEKHDISRVQRRQYVRVDTAVDLAVHSLDQSFPSFSTVTTDVSGGGLSFIIPNGVKVNENMKASVWMVLPMNSGEYQYICVEGEVVRLIDHTNTAQTASLKFNAITKQSQQNIIRYCFEVQREQRQKELD